MESRAKQEHWYEFGPFRLQMPERTLLREGRALPLTPKALETLWVLVERWPHVVEKDELLREVWGEVAVEEATLAQNVFTLRKALGGRQAQPAEAEGGGDSYIVTVPKRGYRFAVPVRHYDHPSDSDEYYPLETINKYSPNMTSHEAHPPDRGPAQSHKEDVEPLTPRDRRSNEFADGLSAVRPNAWRQFRQKHAFVLSLIVFLLGSCLILFAGNYQYRRLLPAEQSGAVRVPFQSMSVNSLHVGGRVTLAAISPDGKYIVHAVEENGQQSLCVRQSVAANTICTVPPAAVSYTGITFSHDGDYIYFVSREIGGVIAILYRIPILGGAVQKLITDVDTAVTLSPDSEQLAFTRFEPAQGQASLIVARKDGTGERKILTYKHFDYRPLVGPAWSPDGQVIAFAKYDEEGTAYRMGLSVIGVADGVVKPAGEKLWIGAQTLCWLSDGSGLLAVARDESRLPQIWHASYPGGAITRVTNDLNHYHGISLTKDAKTLLTVQYNHLSNMWVASPGKEPEAVQVTGGKFDGLHGIAWTPNRQIIYTVRNSTTLDLWVMDADGKNKRQLTDQQAFNHSPDVSPDGRYVVFASNRAGALNLWRMDADGKNFKQLTFGKGERNPAITPDGGWVVYANVGEGRTTIWKVPIDGGEPIQLTDRYSLSPVISPNGDLIACFYWNEKPEERPSYALIPIAGGQPIKTFDFPTGQVAWTRDGQGLTYVNMQESNANIWLQPIGGGPPRKLTNFPVNSIFNFAWSRDGKQIAYASGASSYDLVMLREGN